MKAFIYSLDGFISLLIAMFAIQLLVSSVTYMQFREPIFYKAKLLAADISSVLSELAVRGETLSCDDFRRMIPEQYSFRIEAPGKLISRPTAVGYCERGDVSKSPLARVKVSTMVVLYDVKKPERPNYPPLKCNLTDTTTGAGKFNVGDVVIEVGV